MGLIKQIGDWERNLRAYYNTDLSTPENRRRAQIYNLWFDHAILRKFWTNFFPVADGVYRSNQPTHARFVKLKEMGIKSVLNLRGAGGAAHYLVEEESCRELGLNLVSVTFHARYAAPAEDILKVIEAFRTIERPFVMHCKSGADRAGLAAAIYLMVIEGRPVTVARKMLSMKYIHFKWTKTGVLDYILDLYEVRATQSPFLSKSGSPRNMTTWRCKKTSRKRRNPSSNPFETRSLTRPSLLLSFHKYPGGLGAGPQGSCVWGLAPKAPVLEI